MAIKWKCLFLLLGGICHRTSTWLYTYSQRYGFIIIYSLHVLLSPELCSSIPLSCFALLCVLSCWFLVGAGSCFVFLSLVLSVYANGNYLSHFLKLNVWILAIPGVAVVGFFCFCFWFTARLFYDSANTHNVNHCHIQYNRFMLHVSVGVVT